MRRDANDTLVNARVSRTCSATVPALPSADLAEGACSMAQAIRPVMLVILDGFGWREEAADNAVRQARKPNFDRLWQNCPHAFLHTSGSEVGLPDGQMGNSEVGHLNIGAGRVVMQELPR